MAAGDTLSDLEVLDLVASADPGLILDEVLEVSSERLEENLRACRSAFVDRRWDPIREILIVLTVGLKALESRVAALEMQHPQGDQDGQDGM